VGSERRRCERASAVDEGELPDRCIDRPFVNDLLHLVQDRLAFLAIEFDRLLLIQLVEIGVAAVDKDTPLTACASSRVAPPKMGGPVWQGNLSKLGLRGGRALFHIAPVI
jgi:hypothetical protein